MAKLTETQIDTIRAAWCRDTSADPDKWTPQNPAMGQCAVTALIVQDLIGGELERVDVHVAWTDKPVSHYRNVQPDGTRLDLTFSQFEGFGVATNPQARDRWYVLKFQPTAERYKLLKARAHLAYREALGQRNTTKTAEDAHQAGEQA